MWLDLIILVLKSSGWNGGVKSDKVGCLFKFSVTLFLAAKIKWIRVYKHQQKNIFTKFKTLTVIYKLWLWICQLLDSSVINENNLPQGIHPRHTVWQCDPCIPVGQMKKFLVRNSHILNISTVRGFRRSGWCSGIVCKGSKSWMDSENNIYQCFNEINKNYKSGKNGKNSQYYC